MEPSPSMVKRCSFNQEKTNITWLKLHVVNTQKKLSILCYNIYMGIFPIFDGNLRKGEEKKNIFQEEHHKY